MTDLPFLPDAAGLPGRRLCLRILAGAAIAGPYGAAWAGYNVWTGEYTVPLADLQARLAARFPVKLRYAEIFTLQLTRPQLALDPAQNRTVVTADLQVASPLLTRTLQGVLAISSGLRFDPAAAALRLYQPQTERLDVQGLPERDARGLKDVGAVVAREVLSDYPLHTFKPEELKVGLKTLELGDITVLQDGIKVQLK
jgi:hypothetical protein